MRNNAKSWLLASGCAIFALYGHAAHAEASAESDSRQDTAAMAEGGASSTGVAASRGQAGQSSSGVGNDIVVTARRKAESIQSVPVSVQAFSAAMIKDQNIHTSADLQRLTPGVIFNGSGSDFNTTLTIRGQGRDVIGPIAPSVQSYVNDVPLPSWGAIIPTYDVANVQVLKGPQGTLFGRNTTGGAVLVNTKQPTYDFGGYVTGQYGNFDDREVEGALNVPLIKDAVALRVAGQIRRRDGYVKGGYDYLPDAQNVHSDNFRVSLLLQPIDAIRNVTVYDYSYTNIHAISIPVGYGTGTGPNGENAIFHSLGSLIYGVVGGTDALFDCGTSPTCDGDLAIQRSIADKYRRYYSSLVPFSRATVEGITNTTTIDLGSVSFKNIFGFRRNRIREASDTDGMELVLIDAFRVLRSDDQITNEGQFSGSLFNGTLDWLVGGFYLKNKPKGPNSISFSLFQPTAAQVEENPFLDFVSPFLRNLSEAVVAERSEAVFGSLSQDLGSLVPGLKLNLSGRYTWDHLASCAANLLADSATPSRDFNGCKQIPGVAFTKASFEKFTWAAGLDYQVTPRVFLYGVARRGYRAGGINTPNLGGTLVGFQTFRPQTVDDREIGIKADWNIGAIRGRTNLSGYTSKFSDLQQQATGLPPGADGDGDPLNDPSNTSLIVNSGKARTRGIDLDGFVIPFEGFQINYGLALFHGHIKQVPPAALIGFFSPNNKFDRAPSTAYTIGAHYQLPEPVLGGQLNFDINWYHTSSYKVGLAPFKAYGLLNGFIGINDIGGLGIDAQIFGQNLTNEKYFLNPNASGPTPGFITESLGLPRTYGIRLTYTFGQN
jgi:iron complex outermembrane receptor protein